MRLQTTSLTSDAPGSLNGTESHAMFYVFHIVPEITVSAALLSINAREFFSTGLFGDIEFSKKKEAVSTRSS